LVEYYGEDIDGATQLKLKLSHQELANIIGSTRETVTVVLGKLQSEGYLEIARRRIRIKDLPGLAREVAEVVSESTSPEPTKQFTRQNAEHAVPPSNSKRKLSIL
jgi:DNA-binding transcriptional MocR family regulator